MNKKKKRPAFWVTENGAVHVNPELALAHPKIIVALAEVARLRADAERITPFKLNKPND